MQLKAHQEGKKQEYVVVVVVFLFQSINKPIVYLKCKDGLALSSHAGECVKSY